MAKVRSSVVSPVLECVLKIAYEDESVKTFILREGTILNNVSYIDNGVTKTVNGSLKVINFTSKATATGKDNCVHDDESVFDDFVSINSLVLDCSQQYNCNVIKIPIKSIISIDNIEVVEIKSVEVNGVAYTNIQAALDAMPEDGGTINLTEDIQPEAKVYIPEGRTTIINLNDHKFVLPTVADNYGMVVKGHLTIEGNGLVSATSLYGIGVQPKASLTINSGSFKTVYGSYVLGSWGTTTIYDGEIKAIYCCVNAFDGIVEIYGGNFICEEAETMLLGNTKVYGGTFNHPVLEQYCADGYEPVANKNGTYTVRQKEVTETV